MTSPIQQQSLLEPIVKQDDIISQQYLQIAFTNTQTFNRVTTGYKTDSEELVTFRITTEKRLYWSQFSYMESALIAH